MFIYFFSGRQCNQRVTRNPCEWEQNRCNHGKCRVRDGKPVCQCNPGYSGDKCQISKSLKWSHRFW